MADTYRAKTGFHCPADPESLKKAREAVKARDAGEHDRADALFAKVKWMEVEEGAEVVPFNAEILKSWLANDAVEEVKARG